MVRTKYLLVAISLCLLVIVSVGIISDTDASIRPVGERDEVIFGIPKERYTVAGTSVDARLQEREAFKARVRETLRAEPTISTLEEVDVEDSRVTTPIEVLPSPTEDPLPSVSSDIVVPILSTTTSTVTPTYATTTSEMGTSSDKTVEIFEM